MQHEKEVLIRHKHHQCDGKLGFQCIQDSDQGWQN